MTYKEFTRMDSRTIAERIHEKAEGNAFLGWYDYVTALRGPDMRESDMKGMGELFRLKLLFTAFLRGYTPCIYDVADWGSRIMGGFINAEGLVGVVRKCDCSHYLTHVKGGLEAVRKVLDSEIPEQLWCLAHYLEELGNDKDMIGDVAVKTVSEKLAHIRKLICEETK